MFGKYFDNRVHQHLTRTYSRVPYLDTQIFDVQTANNQENRRIKTRTDMATEALERTKVKQQKLSTALKQLKAQRLKQQKEFISDIEKSHKLCLSREKESWKEFTAKKSDSRESYLNDQIYLTEKLGSNSTKAASRLASSRRWS